MVTKTITELQEEFKTLFLTYYPDITDKKVLANICKDLMKINETETSMHCPGALDSICFLDELVERFPKKFKVSPKNVHNLDTLIKKLLKMPKDVLEVEVLNVVLRHYYCEWDCYTNSISQFYEQLDDDEVVQYTDYIDLNNPPSVELSLNEFESMTDKFRERLLKINASPIDNLSYIMSDLIVMHIAVNNSISNLQISCDIGNALDGFQSLNESLFLSGTIQDYATTLKANNSEDHIIDCIIFSLMSGYQEYTQLGDSQKSQLEALVSKFYKGLKISSEQLSKYRSSVVDRSKVWALWKI